MKRLVLMIIPALICGAVFTGCGAKASTDENDVFFNFSDPEYRIGIWVNPDMKDTLEFVNSSKLIRKGLFYKFEEYLYGVENNTLILWNPDYEDSVTYHPILKSEKNIVHLGNMYIGPLIVGYDNSGTFIKLVD